jgi:hypothetical protein
MTIDHWLAIASIISTLIAPVAAGIIVLRVASRINQPKPTPETSQPKNRIPIMGGWFMRFLTAPWYVPPFGIFLGIYSLRTELHRTTPVTREVVLVIAVSVAVIFLNIMGMGIFFVMRLIGYQIDSFSEFGRKNAEILSRIIERLWK